MRRGLLLVAAACGRFGFDGGGAGSDGAVDPTLVVTIPDDRMAGPATIASIAELDPGTVGLSLREALAIAANHAGPDRVAFDPSVFPAGTATTIAIASTLEVAGDATTVEATGAGVVIAPAAGKTIDLVDVTGSGDALDALVLRDGQTALHVTGAGATISNCTIDQAAVSALVVMSTSDVTFQHGTVRLAQKSGTFNGIDIINGQRVHVLDSFIDPGTAWMVHLATTTDSEVTGNTIVGGDTAIVLTEMTARTMVFRNVIVAPTTDSVYTDTTVTDTTVLNNTMYMCSDVTNNGTNTSVMNDLVSSTATDFVDPTNNDFHLVAGSPSIDAAVDVGQDMLPDDPTRRFLGAGPDLGGVESY